MNNNYIKSFAYPVLGNGDDINQPLPVDSVIKSIKIVNEDFFVEVSMNHGNKDIDDLISQGLACYACEVSCPRTRLKGIFKSKESTLNFYLRRKELAQRVEVKPLVVVVEDISGYKNTYQHEDYGNVSFDMEIGDYLVIFPSFHFNVDITDVQLYSAGSILKIFEKKDSKRPWADIEGDFIRLYVPSSIYKKFIKLAGNRNYDDLFHASLALPFLTQAIYNYDESIHGVYQWANVLKDRISKDPELRGYNINDKSNALNLAQILLKDPIERMMDNLSKNLK